MSSAHTVHHYLGQLLSAWKDHPHARIVSAFEALAAFEERERPRAVPTSEQWDVLEARWDVRDFGPLLAATLSGPAELREARLRTLAKRRDPRLGPTLLSLLGGPEGVLAAELLEQLGDPRLVDAVEAALATAAPPTATRLQQTLLALRRLPAPVLWPGHARQCAWAEEWVTLKPPPPGLDALFDVVVRALRDDGPRRVYADALLEVGDSRGEFIRAQLDGRPEPQSVSHDEWLRPLRDAGLVGVTRGFPSSVTLQRTGKLDLSVPQWRTVEVVIIDEDADADDAARLLDSDALPNLRTVNGITGKIFSRLASRSRAWTTVSLGFAGDAPEVRGLEAVTECMISAPFIPEGFFQNMRALERLDVYGEVAPKALRPLTALRGLWVTGEADDLELPATITELSLDGEFTRPGLGACKQLERLFCSSEALAHAPAVPTVREAWLSVSASHARAFEGLSGLRRLTIDAESTLRAGQLSPLRNLLSLYVGHLRGIGAPHLAGLDSLVLLEGLWDIETLPPLPELLCFDGFLPRRASSIEVLLRAAPKLAYLHFNLVSESELSTSTSEIPSEAWRFVARALAPTRVRVVDLSPTAWLERTSGGTWVARTRDARQPDTDSRHDALVPRLAELFNS